MNSINSICKLYERNCRISQFNILDTTMTLCLRRRKIPKTSKFLAKVYIIRFYRVTSCHQIFQWKKTWYRYHMIRLISTCHAIFQYCRPNLQQSFGTPQQANNSGQIFNTMKLFLTYVMKILNSTIQEVSKLMLMTMKS